MTQNLGNQLSTVAHTLCTKGWNPTDIDAELRRLLNACLHSLDAVGIVAYFAEGPVVLQHFRDSAAGDPVIARKMARQIVDKILPYVPSNVCPIDLHVEVDDLTAIVGTCLPPVSGVVTTGGFCAIVYRRPPHADPQAFAKADNFHAQSTAGLIYQVLLHRVRMFNPFAPAVSEAYWDDALLPANTNRRTPPWTKTKGSISTATLSLDLRKSTFCMENADPAWKFALWLDLLVQILTQVTHLHGGVFDKFTGDGALVHFLAPDESEASVANAMVAAFDCALSMHRAMRRHVELLSTFLHFDSDILGAAIGIDVAPAFWSLDHRNNPITVGRAVVNACRIGDKTEAGASRFTNGAYQHLRGLRDVGGMKRVSFVSKEVPEDMKVKVWELPRGVVLAERFVDETDEIVDEVHKQWKEGRM